MHWQKNAMISAGMLGAVLIGGWIAIVLAKRKDYSPTPTALVTSKVQPATQTSEGTPRIPSWNVIVAALGKQSWAQPLQQIPATVIDNGVMRNIPYVSYRCGDGDYEMNIYGDPDAPAAVEIGVYRKLLADDQAKTNCADFLASLMADAADGKAIRALDRSGANLVTLDGMTFEITPETSEDAYGGWWVSAYDQQALDNARASDAEMLLIAQAPAADPIASPTPSSPSDVSSGWSTGDYRYARPPPRHSSGGTSGGGGRVYVKSYTRRDGTYVRSHTRSSPRRR